MHMNESVCGSQKRPLDALELKSQAVVSHPVWVGAENQTLALQKAANALNH